MEAAAGGGVHLAGQPVPGAGQAGDHAVQFVDLVLIGGQRLRSVITRSVTGA